MLGGRIRRTAVAATLLAIAPIVVGAGQAQAVPIYDSCKSIHDVLPDLPDGEYTLRTGSIEVTVYCHDMAGAPREYLSLVRTGGDANFSQYTAGGASPGSSVRTTFTKLRINPKTLVVDIGDLTFSWSTGKLRHGGVDVTTMPYGAAMSCTSAADGIARIDLRDTPFIVTDTFTTGGYNPAGSASMADNRQRVDLTGGGYCGWNSPAPAMYDPFNPRADLYQLELGCAPQRPVWTTRACARYA